MRVIRVKILKIESNVNMVDYDDDVVCKLKSDILDWDEFSESEYNQLISNKIDLEQRLRKNGQLNSDQHIIIVSEVSGDFTTMVKSQIQEIVKAAEDERIKAEEYQKKIREDKIRKEKERKEAEKIKKAEQQRLSLEQEKAEFERLRRKFEK
jgi:hypothetical protein